jgi:hypothetical protein
MNKTTIISMLLATSMLGACASVTPGSPEAYMKLEQEKKERLADTLEDTLDEMPDWYAKLPTSNYAVYAAGTSTAIDPQYAIEKAVFRAKVTLADRIKGKMSQNSKTVIADNTEVGTQVTKNIIDAVEVSGYKVKEQELMVDDGKVRAYVLLEFPIGGYNDVLKYKAEQAAAKNKADTIAKALANN